jgi:hypothetical protein
MSVSVSVPQPSVVRRPYLPGGGFERLARPQRHTCVRRTPCVCVGQRWCLRCCLFCLRASMCVVFALSASGGQGGSGRRRRTDPKPKGS